MAFLWILYQIIISLLRISKASQKSSLASVLLISGFAWFIYTFIAILSNNSAGNAIVSSSLINVEGNEKLNDWLRNTLPIASVAYLVLLSLPLLNFIRNYRYVQAIRQYGLTKPGVEWRMFVKKIAAQMGIKKPVHIWVSDFVSSPVTIGYLKPIILVPIAAINHLSTQQLEAVLLHELSHIRRYDYLINLVINFIQTILYFNPFVKAFVKTVEREREKSCDEMVVQFQYDPHGYASALLILERSHHFTRPLAVAAAGKKYDLLQRIELILGVYKKPVISFNRLAGLFAGLLCIITLNAMLIFSKPANRNREISFTPLSSPFLYLGGDAGKESPVLVKTTVPSDKKEGTIPEVSEKRTDVDNEHTNKNVFAIAQEGSSSQFMHVRFNQPIEVPKLKKYEEAQVKEAMSMSKRVIQEAEWKTLEQNIADVMTNYEKDKLKSAYDQEFAKVNWEQWENKLRTAYDQLDWDRINNQLGNAIMNIKVDSLQKVYHTVLMDLNELQNKLSASELKGIPDTDITLQSVEQRKELAQKILNRLKAVRSKKIIHL